MHAIVVTKTGGPEVLTWSEHPDPHAGPNEVLVRVEFAGVNFIDTYHRTGLYALNLPFVPGLEGAGTVVDVGTGNVDLSHGDRVAWTGNLGSYAELLSAPADKFVPVPDGVPTDIAAAVMLQGLTAHYLVNDTYPVGRTDRVLIHAGAGGVGRLLIQMAKAKGAEVFATVGSAEKAEIAREAGADHVIEYRREQFKAVVERIAGPNNIDVVYDGVGAATFDDGLDLLRLRGTMVAFGNASGPVTPVDPLRLSQGGSLYLTRPTLGHHTADAATLRRRTGDLFDAIGDGSLDIMIGDRFPLADAAGAHRALEGRSTTGKVILEV